jgi:hypothetical protein
VNHTVQHAITPGVLDWAADHPDRHTWIAGCLARHHRHDWGDLDRHDWQLNDRAISQRAGRVLSSYAAPDELDPVDAHLRIITDDLDDPDTLTTILWPHEY